MESLELSVIVVNFNGKQDLLCCLASLEAVREELGFEVIVVDNGSTDGSIEEGRDRFGWAKFIEAGCNLGFAAGCNLGLKSAQGRHAMLLNPDTAVLAGSLRRLVNALDQHPNWGIVGPRMLDENDRPYPGARRFPTPFYLFCECTRLAHIFPRTRFFAAYFYGDIRQGYLDNVDQVEGSALVISGNVRRTVGDLDPRFFLFFEEVDWCKRVRDTGFEIHIVDDATIRHQRSWAARCRRYSAARGSGTCGPSS